MRLAGQGTPAFHLGSVVSLSGTGIGSRSSMGSVPFASRLDDLCLPKPHPFIDFSLPMIKLGDAQGTGGQQYPHSQSFCMSNKRAVQSDLCVWWNRHQKDLSTRPDKKTNVLIRLRPAVSDFAPPWFNRHLGPVTGPVRRRQRPEKPSPPAVSAGWKASPNRPRCAGRPSRAASAARHPAPPGVLP